MADQDNRTGIFVDGNNLYHVLKKIGIIGIPPYNQLDHFKFVNYIRKRFKEIHGIELKEVKPEDIKYYNSVPNIKYGKEKYNKHSKFIQKLRSSGIIVHTRKLQTNKNKRIIEDKKKEIGLLDLCSKCLQIVKDNCVKCIGTLNQKEKGIDISIAIDMVSSAYNDEYDYIVLISGDSDFIPALDLVKTLGKKPLSCFILDRSYASDLRKKFTSLFLKREEIEFNCIKK